MRETNAPIAAEGYPFIFPGLFLCLVFAVLGFAISMWYMPLSLFCLAVGLAATYFFRNPDRIIPYGEELAMAPADGVVIYLGPVKEPHTGKQMEKISIFMSVFNVHVNRAPLSGKVVDTFYTKGKFLDVRHERATFENEQKGIVIETLTGARAVVVQVAGLIARRIVCYAEVGDEIERGCRYGLIRFGSRLDVYLPLGTKITVAMGQETVAGQTIIGKMRE